jgi:hypothetical protein
MNKAAAHPGSGLFRRVLDSGLKLMFRSRGA